MGQDGRSGSLKAEDMVVRNGNNNRSRYREETLLPRKKGGPRAFARWQRLRTSMATSLQQAFDQFSPTTSIKVV